MNDVPQHNLAAVAEAVAQRVPDRTAIVAKGHRFTYDELNRRTRQLAHVLHDHGLGARPGGREGLASHESHQDHLAIYGVRNAVLAPGYASPSAETSIAD